MLTGVRELAQPHPPDAEIRSEILRNPVTNPVTAYLFFDFFD